MIRTEVKNIVNNDWKIEKISALDIGEVILEDIESRYGSEESFALTGGKNEAKIYTIDSVTGDAMSMEILDFHTNKFKVKIIGISQRALQIIKERFFNGR